MAFKFPFTNYHELNLTWVLDQLKALFEQSKENVTTIETYENRLTAVETELPSVSETASEASRAAAAAGSLAETTKATADTAQNNAIQAQGLAGTARQEAQAAQTAANEATQAAQQAQATAQNFDGRITQAENDASQALEASRSFENRVQSAITTANNAARTATDAQGVAQNANQNAARALDTLNDQRSELERIGREQAALISEETESGKTEIENLAQSVIDSIPSDYTTLSNLVDKKAPVIINSASGAVASFNDGADNMKIQKLVVNIEPLQAGSGDPSPHNVRPISGWTGAEIEQAGKNLVDISNQISVNWEDEAGTVYGGTLTLNSDRTGTLWANRIKKTFTSVAGFGSGCGYLDFNQQVMKLASYPLVSNWAKYHSVKYTSSALLPYEITNIGGVPTYVFVKAPTKITTQAEMQAYLAENPLEICAYITSPITYTLTESEISGILETLYGTNNIWADTGDVEVTYPADTKLYIDGKLAEIQATILENIGG